VFSQPWMQVSRQCRGYLLFLGVLERLRWLRPDVSSLLHDPDLDLRWLLPFGVTDRDLDFDILLLQVLIFDIHVVVCRKNITNLNGRKILLPVIEFQKHQPCLKLHSRAFAFNWSDLWSHLKVILPLNKSI